MAASRISLQHIKLFAAEKADMLTVVGGQPQVSGFVTDVSMLVWVNAELAALWDELISSYEDYSIHRDMMQIAAGQEDYPLPKGCYKVRKLFPIESGVRGVALRKFDLMDLGQDPAASYITSSEISDLRYRVLGSRLWLHPIPTGPGVIELWYVPTYTPLEYDQEEIHHEYPEGWEDFVCEGVAARMLEKEESDPSVCLRRQQDVLARIKRMVEDRDVGEPHRVIDAEGYMDWEM